MYTNFPKRFRGRFWQTKVLSFKFQLNKTTRLWHILFREMLWQANNILLELLSNNSSEIRHILGI